MNVPEKKYSTRAETLAMSYSYKSFCYHFSRCSTEILPRRDGKIQFQFHKNFWVCHPRDKIELVFVLPLEFDFTLTRAHAEHIFGIYSYEVSLMK